MLVDDKFVVGKPNKDYPNPIRAVYIITNLINNRKYIGSTVNVKSRKLSHFTKLKGNRHSNKYLQSDFNIHGINNFKFDYYVVPIGIGLRRSEIKAIRSIESHYTKHGYNLVNSISVFHKNRTITEEMRTKISEGIRSFYRNGGVNPKKGTSKKRKKLKFRSIELRKLLSKIAIEKKIQPPVKNHISFTKIAKTRSNPIVALTEDFKQVAIFPSIKFVQKNLKINNIKRAISNNQKAGGFYWKRVYSSGKYKIVDGFGNSSYFNTKQQIINKYQITNSTINNSICNDKFIKCVGIKVVELC